MNNSETAFAQTAWSLTDLFAGPDSAELQSAFTDVDARVATFELARGQLSPAIEPDVFLGLIRDLEAIEHLILRVYGFAGLLFAADTQDQVAQTLRARVQQFMAGLANRTLFFNLWWKGLEDADADRLMTGSGEYRYWLEEMRNFKPHTLTEPEEKIINIKDVTGSSALNTLYDAITSRYSFNWEVDGQMRELTRGELNAFRYSPIADVRARAYQEEYRVYGHDGPILGQVYQTLVRDWRNEQVDLRHFSNPLAVRNLLNDIPDDVVDTLLDVAQDNAPVFQRFFHLKARLLGLDRLRRYDIYAPVADSAAKRYDYDQAVGMVLEAFGEFDPRMAKLTHDVFAASHVDSEVRKGKRGGAFCWSVGPDLAPWVLLNYQGQARDVSTIAHEMGHAVHAMLAGHHNVLTFHSSLPLAETASTFGEMLLVDRLLSAESDEAVRREMLFQRLDDAYATIMRQSFFALFERQAHDMIHQGASVDDLAAAYLESLRRQLGDAVEVPEEFRWEWVSIPHIFHTPFYVYAYAFGQLLVLALYQQYKAEGAAFKPRYLSILAAGGSDAPVRILEAAGIDIHSRSFWQGGFDIVAGLVGQLEAISPI